MEEKIIRDQTFDEERALYHLCGAHVVNCVFAGPADGESVLKEARDVTVENCRFSLRYPLWHTERFRLVRAEMDGLTRAPIWYASEGVIDSSHIEGIKCLRECEDITVKNSRIASPEFGWRCRRLTISDCDIESQYFLFECRDVKVSGLTMRGKYSFQYIENMEIENSFLDTKDAFWHTKNVTVKNSVLKGEYLGWYSENLTLIDCKIIGTQPLCYCKGLKLMNCTTEDADLAFEYSEVDADIRGGILSIKNPASGRITADSIGEIVTEDSVIATSCEIILRGKDESAGDRPRVIHLGKAEEKNDAV